MNPPRPEPRSGLPAPYEDPWRRLAVDLRAVLASVGLRLRELWRRNGEGDLPRPGAWPASLAPLFWPLLLALVLLAAGALMVWLVPRLGAGLARPAAAPEPSLSREPGGGAVEISPGDANPPARGWPIPLPGIPASAPEQEGPTPSAAFPGTAGAPAAQGPVPSAQGPEAAPSAAPGSPDAAAAGAPAAAPDSPIPSPAADAGPSLLALRAELLGDDPAPWILELEAIPAQSLLRLHLDLPFSALEEAERRSLVDRWWERCQALGYERLELLDRDDRLLARPARVGSGMILLDSSPGRR
jgi:hypothetical protein